MARRIDGKTGRNPQIDRVGGLEAAPVGPSKPRAPQGLGAMPESNGRLFSAHDATRRARRADQRPAGQPAQLQVHQAPLVAPPREDVATGPSTPVPPLRRAFDSLSPRSVQGDVRLMVGNVESWLGIWDSLSRAKGDIDASYFIFQRDVFGMAYLGGMLRKANDGQRVRLMLDAAGDTLGKKGFTLTGRGQDYLQELVSTGNAQVKVYHPLHKKLITNLKSGLSGFSGVANNHDKLLRTEDRVVTGGRNISKDYFTDPKDRSDVYRDTDVLVEARAASRAFAKAFDTEWKQDDLHFSVYADVAGNWVRRDLELLTAASMMDHWLDTPRSAADKDRLRTDGAYRNQQAEALLEAALATLPEHGVTREAGAWDRRNLRKIARELAGYAELAGSRATFDVADGMHRGQEVKVIDRASAAVKSVDDLTAALARLADGAQERIIIQNPYVVLTENAIAALERAADRGVQIDLLTNSPDSSDSVLTQAFFLEDWPRILARVPTMRIFVLTGEQKLHAKAAAADDAVSVIGSYNLDLLSEQVNGEIAMTSYSKDLARDVRKSFEADLADPAHGVVEYTIAKDAQGQAILRNGEPQITYGPKDHMSWWKRTQYSALQWLARVARKLPALEAISGIELPGRRG